MKTGSQINLRFESARKFFFQNFYYIKGNLLNYITEIQTTFEKLDLEYILNTFIDLKKLV